VINKEKTSNKMNLATRSHTRKSKQRDELATRIRTRKSKQRDELGYLQSHKKKASNELGYSQSYKEKQAMNWATCKLMLEGRTLHTNRRHNFKSIKTRK
jgi:hypothetical protein